MSPYLVIIVIYGKRLSESSTISSFTRFSNFLEGRCRIVVWDNSPLPNEPEELEKVRAALPWAKIDYRHNQGENIPLSQLYNRSIELLHDDEVMVILDDDSQFDEHFFLEADKAILEHPDEDLFLPIVHNGKDIVSPAVMVLFKGHYLKQVSPGRMECRHRTAINSGMMIRARYLKHGFEGYDERIRFYFTDNDFMSRFTATHSHFFVLDYHLQHRLDFYARGEDFEHKAKRFKELRRSFLILMRRRSLWAYWATQVYMFIYSIKFAIIHRDIRYIFAT